MAHWWTRWHRQVYLSIKTECLGTRDIVPTHTHTRHIAKKAEFGVFTFMHYVSHATWAVEIILCTDAEYRNYI